MADTEDVFSRDRAQETIKEVLDVLGPLTIAEAVHVGIVVDRTLKASYPEVYKVMNRELQVDDLYLINSVPRQ